MSRTREQERLKKRRQRERLKSGEWYALVEIEPGIVPVVVLLGLVGQRDLRDRAAIKAAIRQLVDRYIEGGIHRLDHIDQWRYLDPSTPSAKSQARRKLEQRRRREDGWFLVNFLITAPLVGALVRDGYVSDGQDHADVAEGLALMLWEIATSAAMPMPRDQYGVYLW